MPKYRLLTNEELVALEKEFVEYLILNGITASDWILMKTEEKEKAEKCIELFSDVVFEGVLRKIKYLEFREKKSLTIFQCNEKELVAVSLNINNETADLTNAAYLQQSMIQPPEGIKLTTKTKSYTSTRENELFEMLQSGCVITDDSLFKTLAMMLPVK